MRAPRRRACAVARVRLALAASVGLWAQVATAAPKCQVEPVPSIVFTGYTPFGAGAAGSTLIAYRCPAPIANAAIAISTPRVMSAGAGTLQFDVYRSPYPGPPWTSQPPISVPSARQGSVTVYAFLPPQDASAGSYQTTLDVTVYADGVASETVPLVVTALVLDSCTITAGTLSFGPYDPIGTNATSPRDAQATLQIACTRATPWSVSLGPGSFPAGATRQMANGTGRLQYELYSDAARSSPWTTTAPVAGVAASTAPVNLVVHGRIPAGQTVSAGTYGDSVTSTINF